MKRWNVARVANALHAQPGGSRWILLLRSAGAMQCAMTVLAGSGRARRGCFNDWKDKRHDRQPWANAPEIKGKAHRRRGLAAWQRKHYGIALTKSMKARNGAGTSRCPG